MLSKEERKAIAERLHEYEYIYDDVLYKVLFGCEALEDATIYDNNRAVLARNYISFRDCIEEFNEAIKHYKKLAWKEEQ